MQIRNGPPPPTASMTGLDDLIARCFDGCSESPSRLADFVHEDFYEIAERLCGNRFNGSMHATNLLNETFMRLIKSGVFHNPISRAFLFSSASRTMRNVIADYLRKKSAAKRDHQHGGAAYLDRLIARLSRSPRKFEDLHEALVQLEKSFPRKAEVVNMRYFFAMTTDEIAKQLNVSVSTVESDWRTARVWLFRQLSENTYGEKV